MREKGTVNETMKRQVTKMMKALEYGKKMDKQMDPASTNAPDICD